MIDHNRPRCTTVQPTTNQRPRLLELDRSGFHFYTFTTAYDFIIRRLGNLHL
jgi:hypothetical protein